MSISFSNNTIIVAGLNEGNPWTMSDVLAKATSEGWTVGDNPAIDGNAGQFYVRASIQVGDGTTETRLVSVGEQVRIASDGLLAIKDNATLRLGERHPDETGGWGRKGSMWTISPSGSMHLIEVTDTGARFEQYASLLRHEGSGIVYVYAGTWAAVNSVVGGNANAFQVLTGATLDWRRTQINHFAVFLLQAGAVEAFDDVHLHGNTTGVHAWRESVDFRAPRITGWATNDINMYALGGADQSVRVVNPVHNIEAPAIAAQTGLIATLREVYTCNLTIVDANGDPIQGVAVACRNRFDTVVFGPVLTDENGQIEPQEIVYKQWRKVGADPVQESTYTPHRFIFEREGYQTLVMPDVYVDSPQSGGVNMRVPMMAPTPSASARHGMTYIGPWQ